MPVFDQRGQSINTQVNLGIDKDRATTIFHRHRSRYQVALDQAMAANDTAKAGLLAARLSALTAFASDIGIEEV